MVSRPRLTLLMARLPPANRINPGTATRSESSATRNSSTTWPASPRMKPGTRRQGPSARFAPRKFSAGITASGSTSSQEIDTEKRKRRRTIPAALAFSRRTILVQFLAAVVQDSTRDNYHVDLLRTFEDVVDLGVAHPFLDQDFARVAQRPQQLYRLLRNLRDRQAGLRLRHRGLEAVALAGIEHPGRPPGEQARSLQLHFHLHEVAFDGGQAPQRDSVADRHVLLLEKVAHEVQRRASHSEGHGRDDRPRRIEGRHHVLEAAFFADFSAAQNIVERNPAVVQND